MTAPPNFTITPSPASLSVALGSSGKSTIATAISGSFNAAITLSASGQPSGVMVSFNPVTIAAPGPDYSVMSSGGSHNNHYRDLPDHRPPGGTTAHDVTLTVFIGPSFTITPSPALRFRGPGVQRTSTITTAGSGGFNSDRAVRHRLYTGVTVSFNPTSMAVPGPGPFDDVYGRSLNDRHRGLPDYRHWGRWAASRGQYYVTSTVTASAVVAVATSLARYPNSLAMG